MGVPPVRDTSLGTFEIQMKLLGPLLAILAISSCDQIRGSGQWEIMLHDVDTFKAFTIRQTPGAPRELTVIFTEEKTGVLKPRYYRLPDGAKEIPETEVTFFDTTRLPGRITLRSSGHTFDIMERGLFIDDIEFLWDRKEPIKIK